MADSVTNAISDNSVYTGAWINWAYGPYKGATITLDHRSGGLLIVFLALFVTFVGRCFWRLFCFIAHTRFSRGTSQDGLYHQRQAILRNAATGTVALQSFILMAWSWRKRAPRWWLRLLPMMMISTLIVVGFNVAGIFSSQIATATGNEVLIANKNCGIMIAPDSILSYYQYIYSYMNRRYISASAYAQQCYDSNSSAQTCSTYVRKALPFEIDRNASCPFPGKNICLHNSANIRLDTGLLNSHDHLGINAPPEKRFAYRRVDECAPLVTDGYTRINSSKPYSSENASLEFLYGNRYDGFDNATYRRPLNLDVDVGAEENNADYKLDIEYWEPGYNNESSFTPIPELAQDDGLISLYFISADGVKFLTPVDDDWYSARQLAGRKHVVGDNDSFPIYEFDHKTNVLGCVGRDQFCDLHANRCSPLALEAVPTLTWSSEEQEQIFTYWFLAFSSGRTALTEVPRILRNSALQARNSFSDGNQGPIPPNQWQEEVIHWQGVSMANLQKLTVDIATGPSDENLQQYVYKTVPEYAGSQSCLSQKVRSTAYTSFSVLGLAIALIIGGVIILMSIIAEPFYLYLQARRRKAPGDYRRLEWISNETLQLQRMAHQEFGLGTWTGGTSSVPVTEWDERLGVLDLSDEKHPTVLRSSLGPHDSRPNEDFQDEKGLALAQVISHGTSTDSNTVVHSPSDTITEARLDRGEGDDKLGL